MALKATSGGTNIFQDAQDKVYKMNGTKNLERDLIQQFDAQFRAPLSAMASNAGGFSLEEMDARRLLNSGSTRTLSLKELKELREVYSCTDNDLLLASIFNLTYGALEFLEKANRHVECNDSKEDEMEHACIFADRISSFVFSYTFLTLLSSTLPKEYVSWFKSAVSLLLDSNVFDRFDLETADADVQAFFSPSIDA